MHISFLCAIPLSLAVISSVTGAATFIGKDKNVLVQVSPGVQTPIVAPNTTCQMGPGPNVCGNTCNTNCFHPRGGGPDPNDCHVIADALLFDSENIGDLFEIGTGSGNTVSLKYRSCNTFFANQAHVILTYCRIDWAAVLNFVAFNCQSDQDAHGGNCVAADQRWFIQVQST